MPNIIPKKPIKTFDLSAKSPIQAERHVHTAPGTGWIDMHHEFEVGIVLSGSMERHYGNWKTMASANTAWFCNTWEPHGFRVIKAPCEVIMMVVMPEILLENKIPQYNLAKIFMTSPRERPHVSGQIMRDISRMGEKLKSILKMNNQPKRQMWLKTLLFELLLTMEQGYSRSLSSPFDNPGDYSAIQPAIKMAFESQRNITLQEAAKACSMSRNTFAKHFQKISGIAFPHFALRRRLKGAAFQIANSNNALKSIARAWGFTDISHLHRWFVPHFGCTPGQYRKRAIKALSAGTKNSTKGIQI